MKFQVLMVVSMKATVFWDVVLCSPDDGGSMTSETFVNFCETTQLSIPEDSHLRGNFCQN
jgi:hypothetical protein